MSTLNGKKMQVGNVVYDVLKGAGKVIDDGGGVLNVTVDFGSHGQMNFSQDGKFQGYQRLYWKPPYLIQPRGQQDEAYEQTVALSKIIYDFFVSYETKQQGSE